MSYATFYAVWVDQAVWADRADRAEGPGRADRADGPGRWRRTSRVGHVVAGPLSPATGPAEPAEWTEGRWRAWSARTDRAEPAPRPRSRWAALLRRRAT